MRGIEWLAGLLEGEASFGLNRSRYRTNKFGWRPSHPVPVIQLCMTDKDMVEEAAKLIGGSVKTYEDRRKGSYKTVWRTSKSGPAALAIMLSIFPFMGSRRRQRIEEILSVWEHNPQREYVRRK